MPNVRVTKPIPPDVIEIDLSGEDMSRYAKDLSNKGQADYRDFNLALEAQVKRLGSQGIDLTTARFRFKGARLDDDQKYYLRNTLNCATPSSRMVFNEDVSFE